MNMSIMYTYVIGSDKAVELYQKAFNATLIESVPNEVGTFFHALLDIEGAKIGVAERNNSFGIEGDTTTGNTMQFSFCYGEGEGNEDKIMKAYEVLKEGATVLIPPQSFDHTPLCIDLIDKFGVRWNMFI